MQDSPLALPGSWQSRDGLCAAWLSTRHHRRSESTHVTFHASQIFLEKRIGCHDGLSDGCDGEKHGSHDGERSLAPFGAASGSGIPHGLPSAHASPEDGGDGPDDEDVGLCNLMVGFATADEEC